MPATAEERGRAQDHSIVIKHKDRAIQLALTVSNTHVLLHQQVICSHSTHTHAYMYLNYPG